MLDIALLVPFQGRRFSWVDPGVRRAFAPTQLVTTAARDRLVEYLGASPKAPEAPSHRSLTAVTLATSLARGGIRWKVIDPGEQSLAEWRRAIERLAPERPRAVGISSTFVLDGYWLGTLCEMVRRILPEAKLVIGGYYYASDAQQFLSLDADVLCVGEGERRIVEIVRAVRDGTGLEQIAGLYVRAPDGRLRYTGDVEPLRFEDLPLPDWTLSDRIEPPVEPGRDSLHYCVETQRGCVFKCEFCTYRTLAAPSLATSEHAVRAIRSIAGYHGTLFLIDATATTPRARFQSILEGLVREGGSPLPMNLYARVSDLDDEICALMARAGVTTVTVGQESGDQRMLNQMKKGTRADQVRPAIDALARHGLRAIFCFLFGFPGETVDSLATTRQLIRTINDGHEASPPVHFVGLHVFDIQDFAAVSLRPAVKDVAHRYGYDELPIDCARAADERLTTWLELARIPHAPASGFGSGLDLWSMYDRRRAVTEPLSFYRWAKAVDRALAVFVEGDLGGRTSRRGELSGLKAEILGPLSGDPVRSTLGERVSLRIRHRLTWRVLRTWARDEQTPGVITRSALGWEVGRAMGTLGDAWTAARSGTYPRLGKIEDGGVVNQTEAEADRLVQLGIATGRRRLVRAG